jgi:hypothetical protein
MNPTNATTAAATATGRTLSLAVTTGEDICALRIEIVKATYRAPASGENMPRPSSAGSVTVSNRISPDSTVAADVASPLLSSSYETSRVTCVPVKPMQNTKNPTTHTAGISPMAAEPPADQAARPSPDLDMVTQGDPSAPLPAAIAIV